MTELVRLKYGYDRTGNRLYRRDEAARSHSAEFDELYGYDGLNRLTSFDRGELNGGNNGLTGGPTLTQGWTLDPTGNWSGFAQTVVNALTQTRAHNTVNEITGIGETVGTAWPDPAYDAGGNMTGFPKPTSLGNGMTATYDAWNRPVKLTDSGGTVAEYRYDGLNRRTEKIAGGTTRHCYFSDQWQTLEERTGSSTSAERQFVWGIRYVDDLVLRDRTSERLYALQDALFNVVALTNASGAVQERFAYQPYGQSQDLNPNFTSYSGTDYQWEYRFTGRQLDLESGLQINRHRYLHLQLGRWASRDPIGYADGLSAYPYVRDSPLEEVDPSGLKVCSSVRRTESQAPWEFNVWIVEGKIIPESVFEGRECQVNCENCSKGVEFTGALTLRYKVQLKSEKIPVPVGPVTIPMRVFGSGEGGGKFSTSFNSCTGKRDESGCGFIRFSGGIESCTGLGYGIISLAEACVKGELYWRKQWCTDRAPTSCWGGRVSAKFCTGFWKKSCREYILLDINTCDDGDAGGG